jgi:predicted nuclease with TOPRIM domain
LEAKYDETRDKLAERDAENSKLRETISMRKEMERETKKKLKEWVA